MIGIITGMVKVTLRILHKSRQIALNLYEINSFHLSGTKPYAILKLAVPLLSYCELQKKPLYSPLVFDSLQHFLYFFDKLFLRQPPCQKQP